MLKSTFKKVSAIAIAGTMLAGMMAVPANAMTAVPKTEKVTTTVINEDFNGYQKKDHNNLKKDMSIFPEKENIQYKHYVAWEGARRMEVEADTVDGRTGNILTFDNNSGIYLNFDNPSGSTPVALGDIVTISFRYKFETNKQNIKINLNGNTSGRYTNKGGAYDPTVYPDGGAASTGSKPWSSTTEGRLVNLSLNNNTYQVNNEVYKDNKINRNTWYTMTITINTKDAAQNNTQTIKIDNGDGTYLYGLYDATYTGDGDPTYDPFTEITSLQFTTNGCGSRTDGGHDYVSIDDVTVSVTGDHVVGVDYVSDLSKTLVDENFANLAISSTANTGKDIPTALTGTNLTFSTVNGSTTVSNGYPTDTAGENALKFSSTANDRGLALFVGANEQLEKGDLIHMSFDYYQTNQNQLAVFLKDMRDKTILYKSIASKNGYGTNQYPDGKNNYSDWQYVQTFGNHATADNNATLALTGVDGSAPKSPKAFLPIYPHDGSITNAQSTFLTNEWYTVEITIDTCNENYGGKQTMSMKYKKKGADDYLQTYLGYLDVNDSTNVTVGDVDRLTAFKGFDIGIRTLKKYSETSCEAYIDNVKCSIVSPGFEVKDVDNQGNTYTFRDTTPIDLNYVTNASAASKVIIAQYDNTGRLISATPQAVAATGRDTVTVTPVANANLIKLMILDMESAVPYAKVFKLTKSN